MKIFFLLWTLFVSLFSITYCGQQAVCIVPIADLIGDTPQKKSAHLMYESLAIAPKNFDGPARVHQLLFNEIVNIKATRGNEVLVELPHLFYETSSIKQPQTTYWTLAKHVRPLQKIKERGVALSIFPQPLTRNKQQFEKAFHNTVSLVRPFFDTTTDSYYSAGTRFVVAGMRKESEYISVHVFDPKKNGATTTTIPKNMCLVHEEKSNEERIADFVRLVTSWAHLSSGFIPYVWGGCSVSHVCSKDLFVEENEMFKRPELATTPITGLDCTGLVARAAHLAGIPYFYKNSFTISKYLAPLRAHEKISEGDLIWIPGHVMVVSSLKDSLLVEARHYSHGYGKVHEIPISHQFKGVQTYKDLVKNFFAKKSLTRLDKQGKVAQIIPEFKILKLANVWQAS